MGEAEKAEIIATSFTRDVMEAEEARVAVPLVRAVRDRASAIARSEVERALQRRLQGLSPEDAAAVSALVEGVVNKLLHPTMAALRASSTERLSLAEAAVLLHGLEPEGISAEDLSEASPPAA